MEVVQVAQDDHVRVRVGHQERVRKIVHYLRLQHTLHLAQQDWRLETTEERIIAALGVEMIGDHEHFIAFEGEFACQRFSAVKKRQVGRIDSTRTEGQLSITSSSGYSCRVGRKPSGSVDKRQATIGAE